MRRNLREMRTGLILALWMVLGVFSGTVVEAQKFPAKPIEMVIPFGAGGSSDIIARGITGTATEFLGQPVVIQVKPGGGGAIGSEMVARAKPDGYTLLFGHTNCNTILPAMENRSKGPDDFAPVCAINIGSGIFVGQPDAPFKTFKEMIAWAKANPGQLTFGTTGAWSVTDFLWKQIQYQYGIETKVVTYTGGGEALTGILGGHIMVSALAPTQTLPHIKAGKLRALAISGFKRLSALPDVPTMLEEGFDTTIGVVWQGVLAPKGTPGPVVDALAAAFKKMTETQEAIAMMQKFSDEFDFMGTKEFGKYWLNEYQTYKDLGRLFKK